MSARFPSRFTKDPNEIETFPIKMFGCPELVVEVCQERNIPHVLERPDANEKFLVLHITCNYDQKKSAQIEWIRRMTIGGGKKHTEDLFA